MKHKTTGIRVGKDETQNYWYLSGKRLNTKLLVSEWEKIKHKTTGIQEGKDETQNYWYPSGKR